MQKTSTPLNGRVLHLFLVACFFMLSKATYSQYCAAANTDCGFEYITNVAVSDLNHPSLCDQPYDDFTAQTVNMQVGSTYNGVILKSSTLANYVASVFIDWNQNNQFDLPAEEIQATPNVNTDGFTFTVTPAAGATLGTTRMRVRMVQNGNPAACDTFARGDVEDYTVVLSATAPNGPANDFCSGAIVLSPGAVCNQISGNTEVASQQFAPSTCGGNTALAANELWYSFTANGTSIYTINANAYGIFNPVIALYSGCNATDMIQCEDANGAGLAETLNTPVLAAGTYYYRIYGNGGNGTFTTCVIDNAPAPGDECADAMVLENVNAWCSGDAAFSNAGQSGGGFGEASCWDTTANDVWFRFTAGGPQQDITVYGNGFGTNTLTNPQVALYSGACEAVILGEGCAAPNLIADSVNLNVGGLVTGETYLIRVDNDDTIGGTFELCVNSYSPPVVTGQDCPDAKVLCDKSQVIESNVVGFGNDGNEAANSCLAAGVNGGGLTEQNSAWYSFTAADNGTVTFDITPLANYPDLDIDFVLYELNPSTGCQGRVQLRCMGASCPGATGLNATSLEATEPPGCDPPNDNYLQQLTMTAGSTYGLLVNNFQTGGAGYTIDFGGTGTFARSAAAFTAEHTPNCGYPKEVTVTDASDFADNHDWNFGADASPATANTAGPHTVQYNTPGLKTISLTVSMDNGCDSTITMNVFIPDTMTITPLVTDASCGNANGEVNVQVVGGNGDISNFMYSLDGGTPQSSNTFTGLSAGSHTIEVLDSISCSQTLTFDVQTTVAPEIDPVADVSACDFYTLPAITGNNLTVNAAYYTGPNGTGTQMQPGTVINSTQLIYVYDFTQTTPSCTDEESFNVTINEVPTVTGLNRTCDATSTSYTVSFTVTGGDAGSYTVTNTAPGGIGGSFSGNVWTSNAIPSGTAFTFEVDDANSCGPVSISGIRDCGCATQAGAMDLNAISECGNNPINAIYDNTNEFTDANDAVEFILHDNSGASIGNIIARGGTPTFTFQGTMTYGTTYYISAVVGDDLGAGQVDINDACTDVTAGTPVLWNDVATGSISGTQNLCAGGNATIFFNFTGTSTYSATVTDGNNTQSFTNLVDGSTATVNPTQNATYTLVSITDMNTGCSGTVDNTNNTASFTVTTPPTATTPTYVCNATGTGYFASFDVNGGNGGPYIVNEVSPGGIGGSFSGNTYTSNEIPSGVSFSFEIDDANACGPTVVSGSHDCACLTQVGQMDGNTLEMCDQQTATATYDQTNEVLDADDVVEYVLHTGPSNVLGTVIDSSATAPSFGFGGNMTYGTTYYISAVAGNDQGNGFVDKTDGCMQVAVGTPVVWNQSPQAFAGAQNTQVCEGDDINLTSDNVGGAFYNWTGPDGYTANTQNPVINNVDVANGGTYDLTVLRNGCSTTSSVSITVNPVSDARINNNPAGPFCSNDNPVTFTSPSSGGTWSGPGISNSNSGNFNPATAGVGTHTITHSFAGQCPTQDTKTVIVNAAPEVNITASATEGCAPLTVSFENNTANTQSIQWTFGDGTTSMENPSTNHVYVAGTYNVTVDLTSNGCTSTETFNNYITVDASPIAAFTSIDKGDNIFEFINESIDAQWFVWEFENGTTSEDVNPIKNFGTANGSQEVILIAGNMSGCTDSAIAYVDLKEELVFYVPNAFTPNADVNNQLFQPVMTSGYDVSSYELRIFNRWGELVFISNDPNKGWDGSHQGWKSPTGVYSYNLSFITKENLKKINKTGSFHLIR